MNAEFGFFESLEIELEIYRRVVDRIAAEHDEQVHASGIEIVNQILQRLPLVH